MKFKNRYLNKYNWKFCIQLYMSQKKNDIEFETYKTYSSKFNVFCNWLNDQNRSNMNINKTDEKLVSQFIAYIINERKVSKKTIHEYKELLKSTCKHFVKIGLLTKNPFDFLPKVRYKADTKKPQILPDHVLFEMKDYFMKTNKQMWLVCMFLFYCFIRPKEMRFLKIGDIDFNEGYITVRGEIAKNDKTQTVIIPDLLLNYLISEQYHIKDKHTLLFNNHKSSKNNIPVGRNYFSNQFRKMRNETKIDFDYKFYSLKHTGGVKLKKSGADLIEMKKQFRHYSIEQTYQYICSLENEDSPHIRKNSFVI